MIDNSSLLKSQGRLYLEFIPKDGLFDKNLLLSLMGFKLVECNIKLLCDLIEYGLFYLEMIPKARILLKKSLQ